MSIDSENTKSRLFLVCPNGFMEVPVREKFGDNSYFFTAMAVFFEWDEASQHNLMEFVQRRNISEIYFVGNLDNPLYVKFIDNPVIPLRVPWERQLALGYTDLKTEIEGLAGAKMKNKMLLADYLERQMSFLKALPVLGSYLLKEDIKINAVVYDPADHSFQSATKVSFQGKLLSGICYN
ncbi:hypothetical protein ESY86_05435 [Subsaximicrobium wynnwilliamsii]|uniref:Uncharacterized protein n=1 Tax=Subsaximicrobium wynnwilliamsii TaxID=291179 RepID=A0A5C6ZJ46_9FLAO|nr:hypothetical protein [Subsaximicrobium wynnwilliamsii]TXD84502.1 hypothetical protein ESY87_05210 [Subsaximicrobium wynnwilliamsii]TXD90184.1 hypothetical protein ESY86_05435 [Subsaximicrobium wynnwilliamsii]TXE04235.1 hypothetical protein ESY88_05205 [Subsaximicrobium wynnwilliamsii]